MEIESIDCFGLPSHALGATGRLFSLSDDVAEAFKHSPDFFLRRTTEAPADSLDGECPDLADLDP